MTHPPDVPESQPQEPTPPEPTPQEPGAQQQATKRNKQQAWLYIVIGLVLGVVAVLGLVADDRGFLDWALLVLAIANLVIGVMGLRKPDPISKDPSA